MQEEGIYITDADTQPPRNPTDIIQSVMTCPILKRPADCTRPGPSRLSFRPKPRPKQCVGELEIPGLPSTAKTLFSGLRVSTHGKQAGPLVGFYHSAGRQPANSTPRPAGGTDFGNWITGYVGSEQISQVLNEIVEHVRTNYLPRQAFEVRESNSALRNFAIVYTINGIEGYDARSFLDGARENITSVLRNNQRTKVKFLSVI